MNSGPEFTTVESPFIDQLICMGRKLVTADLDLPSVTEREMFRENHLACRVQVTGLLTKGTA